MRFTEVVGQTVAKEGLIRMEQRGRMPHALLLLGREGLGGLPLALALAQYLFCERKSDMDACGECPSCQKMQRLEHADLHFTFPVFGPKVTSAKYIREFRAFVKSTPYGTTYEWLQSIEAENKQGNITAEESREIIQQLSLKSYEGGLKIQIIWRPEYLDKSGNILLKVIEEPPAGTVFILVAESSEDILPTILSRTQLVRLAPISPAGISAALAARRLADESRAAQIGLIADGSFTEALRLARQMENDLLPAARELFNAVFTNNGPGMVQFADAWSKEGREGIKAFITYVLSLLQGALRAGHLPGVPLALAPGEAGFAQRFAVRGLSISALSGMADVLTDAGYRIERNAHSKSVLMAMCLSLRQLAAAG